MCDLVAIYYDLIDTHRARPRRKLRPGNSTSSCRRYPRSMPSKIGESLLNGIEFGLRNQ